MFQYKRGDSLPLLRVSFGVSKGSRLPIELGVHRPEKREVLRNYMTFKVSRAPLLRMVEW